MAMSAREIVLTNHQSYPEFIETLKTFDITMFLANEGESTAIGRQWSDVKPRNDLGLF